MDDKPRRTRRLSPVPDGDEASGAVARNGNKAEVAITRWSLWQSGRLPLSEWTDDEIRNRLPAGAAEGSALSTLEDVQVRRELARRIQREYEELWFETVSHLKSIMRFGESDSDRLRAIQMISERAAGKVPDRIDLGGADSWSTLLNDVIGDDSIYADVVDAEITGDHAVGGSS